jgi:uncharacterized SAM-dependent methyltransferase
LHPDSGFVLLQLRALAQYLPTLGSRQTRKTEFLADNSATRFQAIVFDPLDLIFTLLGANLSALNAQLNQSDLSVVGLLS